MATPIILFSVVVVIIHSACAEAPFKLTGRAIERAKEVDDKCRKESGAGQESFLHFVRGDVDQTDNTYKCFVKCVMFELASLTHSGEFNLEEELQNVPPEIREEGHRIVTKCQHEKGTDPCDTAFQIHKCYHDSNPELYAMCLNVWDYHRTS